MRFLVSIAVCALLLCSCAEVFGRRTHRRNLPRKPLQFGGTVIKDGDAEWEVAIMKNRRFVCSGSLLRNDVVLTAAECVHAQDPAEFLVRAGTPNFKVGGQLRKIRQTIYHPDFNEESKSNNVALLELMRPLNSSIVNINTVSLPESRDELPAYITVFGWGIIEQQNRTTVTKHPRFSKAKILSDRRCSRFLRDVELAETVFCTGDRAKQLGVCSFSLGSPAMGPNNVQYGLLTETGECTNDEPPLTVYANLLTARDWIENTMNNDLKTPIGRNWDSSYFESY